MKKTLLTIFAVLAMLCALTVMVSAAEITYTANFGEVKEVSGMPTIEGISTAGRVVLKNDNGTYTTYPTYYIMKNSKTFGTDYANLNAKTGQNYDDSRMIMVEIPEGVTGISGNLFGMDSTNHPTNNLEKIVILSHSYTKITNQTFRKMPTVKSVTIPNSVTEIENWGFCGSTALQEVIFETGSKLETIGNSFSSCTALASVNLEACKKLKSIGSTFNGCTSLRSIALPDSLETIGDYAFYKIGQFKFASDYLPSSLKTIGGHFVSGCTLENEFLYFPEGFTSLSSSYNFNDWFQVNTELTLVFLGKMTEVNLSNVALSYFKSYGDKMPLTMVFAKNTYADLNGDFVQGVDFNGKQGYIATSGAYTTKTSGTLTIKLANDNPNNATSLGTNENGDTIFSCADFPFVGIFCGGDTIEYCYSVRNNFTDETAGKWHRFFTTSWEYDLDAHNTANVHYNKKEVTQQGNCGYDEISKTTCVVCKLQDVKTTSLATGNHSCTDDFNCETSLDCKVCAKTIVEALAHTNVISAIYENGYLQNGTQRTYCTNAGCLVDVTEELLPLFNDYGYSATETEIGGKLSLTQFFGINKANLDKYTKATGEAFEYGFVVSSNNDPMNAENESLIAAGKTYITSQDKFAHDYFAVTVVGFVDNEEVSNVNKALTFCVYVKDGNKISYLDNGETVETVTMKSYNDVLALLATKNNTEVTE